MFTITLDPIIFHVGYIALRWYSLIIITAIAIGVYFTAREAEQKGLKKTISMKPPSISFLGESWARVCSMCLTNGPMSSLRIPSVLYMFGKVDWQSGVQSLVGWWLLL